MLLPVSTSVFIAIVTKKYLINHKRVKSNFDRRNAKPPLPKPAQKIGYKQLKISENLEYILRLENNLSLKDIKKRVELLENPKIRCSSHNLLERIKSPKLGIKDVSLTKINIFRSMTKLFMTL